MWIKVEGGQGMENQACHCDGDCILMAGKSHLTALSRKQCDWKSTEIAWQSGVYLGRQAWKKGNQVYSYFISLFRMVSLS